MASNEKGQPESRPNPKSVVYHDSSESKSSTEFAQALARSVFGRSYIVVHQPTSKRFCTRTTSRIRAWRAPA